MIIMKFLVVAIGILESASALQGGYLSQLNGGVATTTNGANSGSPAFMPPPQQEFMTDDAFFSTPTTGGMADFYSSGPPGSNRPSGPTATSSSSSSSFAVTAAAATATTPSTELLNLWSNQVSVELSASQLYLSASIWFRSRGMPGMAAWMLEESDEERGHGLSILEFAMKKGFDVELQPLEAPRKDWSNPIEVWQDILKAEQTNTQNLLRLAAVADQCGDYGCMAFLDPFHVEQIEAEDKVGAILNKVQRAPGLLPQLDYELGKEAKEEQEEHGH